MISFKSFIEKDLWLEQLAEEYFSLLISEDRVNEFLYYQKDAQYINMTNHGFTDAKNRNRIWWNVDKHLQDQSFVSWASRTLDKLKNYKNLPKQDVDKEPKPVQKEFQELGIIDKDKKRGWVISLRKSKDGKLDSCAIMTVFDMDSGTMNTKIAMFQKKTYKINLDGEMQSDIDMKELEILKNEIKELTDEYEYATLEIEEYPDDKEIRKKFNKLRDIITNKQNRITNLQKSQLEECYIITDTKTNRSLKVILI